MSHSSEEPKIRAPRYMIEACRRACQGILGPCPETHGIHGFEDWCPSCRDAAAKTKEPESVAGELLRRILDAGGPVEEEEAIAWAAARSGEWETRK